MRRISFVMGALFFTTNMANAGSCWKPMADESYQLTSASSLRYCQDHSRQYSGTEFMYLIDTNLGSVRLIKITLIKDGNITGVFTQVK